MLLDSALVGLTGNDNNALWWSEWKKAIPGVLKKCLARAGEVVQKLRRSGSRKGPKSAADSAGWDDAKKAIDWGAHNLKTLAE